MATAPLRPVAGDRLVYDRGGPRRAVPGPAPAVPDRRGPRNRRTTAGRPKDGTMPLAAEVALPARAILGEGPTWDDRTGTLLWVDILASRVHAYSPATGTDTVIETPQHVGAAKPREGGGLVLNLRDGVGLLDPDGGFRWL